MRDESVFLPLAEAYDSWAADYDSADNPMVAGASRVVETLGPFFTGREVFEFGCGTGRNLAAALRLGATEVCGCDISAGMLHEAQRRGPALRLLEQDMAGPLPLPDASVDCALFCLSLEHAADLLPPLREARRLLRPDGSAAVIEIHPFLALGGVAAHFEQNGVTIRMPTFAHSFADYLNAIAKAGLRVESCREWRPSDFGGAATAKMLKRGAEHPLLAQFLLLPA
jgi:malonyl-CoA O-methyltransferase